MARTSKDYNTGTKKVRAGLKARPLSPYFRQIGPNKRLGYIRRATGNGSWVVEERINGKERARTLGQADDYSPANGVDVLTFEQAQRIATGEAPTTPVGSLTVKEAVERYCANLAGRSKHAKITKDWADKRIIPALGGHRIDRLSKSDIQTWLTKLVAKADPSDPDARRRSQSTANRILTILKAALNEAFSDPRNNLPSDTAWRLVKPFRAVDGARQEHFDSAQVSRLIACARTFDVYFANLLEVLYLTGARLGELAAADVRDFDAKAQTLRVSGKTGPRHIALTDESVAVLLRTTQGRPPAGILMPRRDGERWHNTQHRPMQKALALAELTLDASVYTLRHSYISRAIEAGMPLSLIAENCGTSLLMIQRNYAKVLASTRRDTMQKTSPTLRLVAKVA